jgi:DNA-binding response OmpR family regulator
MKTTTAQGPKTTVGVRTASVLADADVWPSGFQTALQEEGFAVYTSHELHELFDHSHDEATCCPRQAGRRFAVRACHAVRGLKDVPTIVVIPSESDFVPVMDAGADDAITASSDGAVFAARVRALLRRAQRWQTGQNGGIIAVRDLVSTSTSVRWRRWAPYRRRRNQLLAVLAEKAGKVLDARTSRQSTSDYDDREAEPVRCIANLRRKLRTAATATLHTLRAWFRLHVGAAPNGARTIR